LGYVHRSQFNLNNKHNLIPKNSFAPIRARSLIPLSETLLLFLLTKNDGMPQKCYLHGLVSDLF
jgi:hypothetical protein